LVYNYNTSAKLEEVQFDPMMYSSTPLFTKKMEIKNESEDFDHFLKEREKDHILTMMNKEIDEFLEKNNKEMEKALEELKYSFEEEIANLDGI
jgi:hypothetical protein